ncbi:hypothetical protein FEQ05_06792 [Burkholderia pseudomultivorans]|uniref:Uncharacterized protein n=1 Tax=Burkholderia pseudomultivorans TaxID=1207504 RepID=A0ABU2EEK8_9BURK|nr:hypothetical protein [Burkholderia pseudomultivorans]MDR8739162.1 hypothetical protein [Burkholderia pseudomultivorans]MDR8745898.1 hypothetical protein [Burkholderia pseudomultivorans]MDR8758334.1 hypothetical protein [Burkholderia pseudomultivorans]MDR8782063.1 hypothetical protein [Burkholderia pseudomultivorans]
MIATYDTHSITWPIQIVTIPRPFGQPNICSSATNSSSSEIPWITSGITSGALIIPVYSVKPLKRPKRASTKPAHVPITTDAVAVSRPIFSDSHAALSNSSSCHSAAYHFSEKPDHTVTSFDSLNEYTTRLTIGMYRNRNPKARTPVDSGLLGLIISRPPVP